MLIKKINRREAEEIIEKREPIGLFYIISKEKSDKIYIGIDNKNGNAWTEEFKSLYYCKRWLMGNFEVND